MGLFGGRKISTSQMGQMCVGFLDCATPGLREMSESRFDGLGDGKQLAVYEFMMLDAYAVWVAAKTYLEKQKDHLR